MHAIVKGIVPQLLALASWLYKMSTYSASGERILQVVDPKLLESVDCSKRVKVPATSVLRCYGSHVALGRLSQQTGQCKLIPKIILCRYFILLLQSTDSSNFGSATCRIRSPLAEYVLILHSQLKLTTAVLRFYYGARRLVYMCICHAIEPD